VTLEHRFAPAGNRLVTRSHRQSTRFATAPERRSAVIDQRKAQQLLGETIRDIGILVVVFGPLDAFFQEGRVSTLPLVLIVAAGLLCIALGIMIEAKE